MAASENVIHITDANFDNQVLKSSQPFLLDLSAEWCQPCKALAPVIEELATEYTGKVRFGNLDVDHNPRVPNQFQVRSMPTLLLFSGGNVIGQLIGAHPRQRIVDLIAKGL
ncbi:MAG: thioredoxin [Myxococcales bacterium]|nr:thioredoxin [Myxococcales bacterium]